MFLILEAQSLNCLLIITRMLKTLWYEKERGFLNFWWEFHFSIHILAILISFFARSHLEWMLKSWRYVRTHLLFVVVKICLHIICIENFIQTFKDSPVKRTFKDSSLMLSLLSSSIILSYGIMAIKIYVLQGIHDFFWWHVHWIPWILGIFFLFLYFPQRMLLQNDAGGPC